MRKIIIDPRFLPTVLILIDVLASARWAIAGNMRQTVYWFAAASLTWAVTW